MLFSIRLGTLHSLSYFPRMSWESYWFSSSMFTHFILNVIESSFTWLHWQVLLHINPSNFYIFSRYLRVDLKCSAASVLCFLKKTFMKLATFFLCKGSSISRIVAEISICQCSENDLEKCKRHIGSIKSFPDPKGGCFWCVNVYLCI